MGKREPDTPKSDGQAGGTPAAPARSRVIVWGEEPKPEAGLLRRLVDRFRSEPEPVADASAVPPAVFRPPVARSVPGARRVQEAEVPTPRLPPVDAWEPPDLSVDPPPPVAPNAPPVAAEGRADPGHGPGPLYRATLQLLPGRLRPLDPDVVREEIRFVRPTGRDAVVTLGWAEGEPPDHVTLNHPSVQDRHARMSFVGRKWRIESLVAGHPVQVNGEVLPVGSEPRELQPGDEVRLGDALFHFLMP